MMNFHRTGGEKLLVSKRSAECWEMPNPAVEHLSAAVEFSMDVAKDELLASALPDG